MNKVKLEINKREFEFSFGLGFLGELLEQLDMTIDETVEKLNKNPFKMIPALMYYSASYVLKREGKEVDFNLYQFSDWLDEAGGMENKSVVIFLNAFTDSMRKDVPQGETDPGTAKKK